ncbi:MAG: murein biosynthesis integral membrane protein MurJ [Proteobacteria bacterium]|nr:murein biosynthesis integral membrane protein MurJ [Pseudomonadota bacterium]MDA1058050.1 murein biosynthesis integral membrane protein MurJ [Pseudomonadota bacterium]
MTLARAIATIGSYTLLSRILGFVRDILVAAILGTGLVADAVFVAFKLPNFFRRLFAEGAFNAGFVPMFSGILERDGKAAAQAFAEQALAVLLATLFIFVTAVQIAMPLAMYGLAPGFIDEPEKFDLTVTLTRLTFPYLLFISLVSLAGGILNSVGRFAAVAATPILLNVTLIAFLGLGARNFATPGHALAWGVAVAGVIQFVWVASALARAGYRLRLPRPRLTPRVRELLWLMLPAAVGAGVVQINLLTDIIIASLLPEGSISFLYFADRVNQLPLGVIGIAVGTALLPLLSRQVAAGDTAGAADSQNRAIEVALFLTLPATAALVVLAPAVVSVLFERGAFDSTASQATAFALIGYVVGLPAYVLIKVLTPGYFARKDTRTPVRIAIIAMIVNLCLNLILIWPLAHVGLALATALAAWLNVALLADGLRRRGHLHLDPRLRRRLVRTVGVTVVMALALWFARDALNLAGVLQAPGTRIAGLAGLVGLGLVIFGAGAHLSSAMRLGELRALMRRPRAAP